MKFPTLTAITFATALAVVPAIAQDKTTPPADASGPATVISKDNNKDAAAVTTNAGPGKEADVTAVMPPVTAVTPPATTATPAPATTATTATNAEMGTATVTTGKNTATVTTGKNNEMVKADNAKIENANALPHQRNPVLADNGQPRAGKIIGSDVYNMQDKKVGSVDDILMGVGGQPDQAVISVKSKLVLVPFDKLIFGNTQVNGDNRVILPDETRDALAAQPDFHYNSQNRNKG